MASGGPNIDLRARPEPVPVATRTPFSFVHINKCGGSSVEIALGLPKRHATAAALRRDLGDEDWAQQFNFSVVRNPFDRVTSIYYYRVRRNYQDLGNRHICINRWVEAVWRDEAEQYNDWPLLNQPASQWLTDEDGTILVDFVARLEDIATDWKTITERLGTDVKLSVENTNMRPPYRDVLTASSRAIIESVFVDDLNRFGYSF